MAFKILKLSVYRLSVLINYARALYVWERKKIHKPVSRINLQFPRSCQLVTKQQNTLAVIFRQKYSNANRNVRRSLLCHVWFIMEKRLFDDSLVPRPSISCIAIVWIYMRDFTENSSGFLIDTNHDRKKKLMFYIPLEKNKIYILVDIFSISLIYFQFNNKHKICIEKSVFNLQ